MLLYNSLRGNNVTVLPCKLKSRIDRTFGLVLIVQQYSDFQNITGLCSELRIVRCKITNQDPVNVEVQLTMSCMTYTIITIRISTQGRRARFNILLCM